MNPYKAMVEKSMGLKETAQRLLILNYDLNRHQHYMFKMISAVVEGDHNNSALYFRNCVLYKSNIDDNVLLYRISSNHNVSNADTCNFITTGTAFSFVMDSIHHLIDCYQDTIFLYFYVPHVLIIFLFLSHLVQPSQQRRPQWGSLG